MKIDFHMFNTKGPQISDPNIKSLYQNLLYIYYVTPFFSQTAGHVTYMDFLLIVLLLKSHSYQD